MTSYNDPSKSKDGTPTAADYEALANFRLTLRRFAMFSELAAAAAELESAGTDVHTRHRAVADDAAIGVDTVMLAMAMAALGLTTHVSAIRNAGVKPLALAALLFAWLIGRRWRRWPAYAIGLPFFLVALFYFFEEFSRLLPTSY